MPKSTKRFAKLTPRRSRASKIRLGESRGYEALEPRQMLATITVNTLSNVADGSLDGLISLREAIIATNTNAAYGDAPAGDLTGDQIRFDPSLTDGTINLQGSELAITDDLGIHGGATNITLHGNEQSRIFSINTSEDVLLARINLTGGAELEGGAVFVQGGGKLRLYFANFTNNRAFGAQSGGGAIFNVDSEILTSNVSFTNNVANGAGGAIFSAAGNVNLYQSTLTGNHANLGGGAVAAVEGTYYFNDTVFSSNLVALVPDGNFDDPTFGGTVARASLSRVGGAVAFAGTNATSVVIASTFDGNEAERNGGAFWVAGGNRLFLLSDTVVSNNVAQSPNGSNLGGGGVFSEGGRINISNAIISGNRARGGSGGGIYLDGGHLQIYNSQVIENLALRNGGGIAANGTFIYANTLKLESNIAGRIPGVSDISHQSPSGGGMYLGSSQQSTALIFNSVIKANVAWQNGGGIYSAGKKLLVSSGTFIGGNHANVFDRDVGSTPNQGGGGIYSSGDKLEVYSSTIQNNRALTEFGGGGGILASIGTVDIGFSLIAHNRAEGNGGGMAIRGVAANLFDTKFEFNRAGVPSPESSQAGGNGGGIFVSKQVFVPLTIVGGSFRNNSATYSGGGIYAEQLSRIVIRGVPSSIPMFVGNQALRLSGGAISTIQSDLIVRDAVFEENAARNGGAMDLRSGSADFTNSIVTNNSARLRGGGLFQVNLASHLDNTPIVDNFAPNDPNIATIFT